MELSQNRPKGLEGKIIAPPMSDIEKSIEQQKKAVEKIAKVGSILAPTLTYLNSVKSENTNNGQDNEVLADFDQPIDVPKFNTFGVNNSVIVQGNVHGNIVTGNNNVINPRGYEFQPEKINEEPSEPKGQSFGVDYSDRSINIKGNVVGSTIVTGDNISVKRGETYSLTRDQIIQDDLGPMNKEEIKTDMDSVLADITRRWEIRYGLEPLPKAEPDLSNQDEILEIINRNWEIKYADLLDKPSNREPQPEQVKQIVRKRDKIKNVLKAIWNKTEELYDKWQASKGAEYDSYIELGETRSPETQLADAIKYVQDNGANRSYKPDSSSTFGKISPEQEARRKKIESAKKIKETNVIGKEVPKKDEPDFGNYSVSKEQIAGINAEFKNMSQDLSSTKTEQVKNESSQPQILDVADQEAFIDERLNSFDSLNTVQSLEEEIAKIENGTIAIPDLIASEADYEDQEGQEMGTDQNGNESPLRLIKIKEYQDARDSNMYKLSYILTALKTKKNLIDNLNEEAKKDNTFYESYQVTIYQNPDGSKYALSNDNKGSTSKEDQLEVTVENNKLKIREPGGKEFVISDYEEKSKNQKEINFNKKLNEELNPIKSNLQSRLDNIKGMETSAKANIQNNPEPVAPVPNKPKPQAPIKKEVPPVTKPVEAKTDKANPDSKTVEKPILIGDKTKDTKLDDYNKEKQEREGQIDSKDITKNAEGKNQDSQEAESQILNEPKEQFETQIANSVMRGDINRMPSVQLLALQKDLKESVQKYKDQESTNIERFNAYIQTLPVEQQSSTTGRREDYVAKMKAAQEKEQENLDKVDQKIKSIEGEKSNETINDKFGTFKSFIDTVLVPNDLSVLSREELNKLNLALNKVVSDINGHHKLKNDLFETRIAKNLNDNYTNDAKAEIIINDQAHLQSIEKINRDTIRVLAEFNQR